jgi:hypothetical protein
MAITNGATAGQQGMGSTVRQTNQARVSFDLDASYPTGGYTSFVATTIAGILGSKATSVISITQVSPAGGYLLFWDRANDTLLVYQYPTAIGPATQCPNATNLAAVTGVEMIVEYV